eukprot:8697706-Lingulodinium_polyedra.AAC.1
MQYWTSVASELLGCSVSERAASLACALWGSGIFERIADFLVGTLSYRAVAHCPGSSLSVWLDNRCPRALAHSLGSSLGLRLPTLTCDWLMPILG